MLGGGIAHLRRFIVDDGIRGAGVGRKLLSAALAFGDAGGYAQTQLWTFSSSRSPGTSMNPTGSPVRACLSRPKALPICHLT